jgi:hypothetical protein
LSNWRKVAEEEEDGTEGKVAPVELAEAAALETVKAEVVNEQDSDG